MIAEPERLRVLNEKPRREEGDHVLYWMQTSQRDHFNPALEHAVGRANDLGLPVRVVFGLTDGYPEANLRHYRFMLEGLRDTAAALGRRGIRFDLRLGSPDRVALEAAGTAALVVCDRGYGRPSREWRGAVAAEAPCRVEQVEGDVVVPVETATNKAEVGARTLRPRIHRHLARFLRPLETVPLANPSEPGPEVDVEGLLAQLRVDRSVPSVERFFRGGPTEARRVFEEFLDRRLTPYGGHRNHPHTDDVSYMSMYLHFGQVSPVWLALQAEERAGAGDQDSLASFLEELIVRRELGANHVTFCEEYGTWQCLPAWARKTLEAHRDDPRDPAYGEERLVAAETHDPYWNAAMIEMRETGYMHNYMRMYWGKKILEWTPDPEEAFRRVLALNNRYFLDGRDPASFANAAWIFGLHDRPWGERAIYGMVRCMTAGGLERKTDPKAYVRKVERLGACVKTPPVGSPDLFRPG